MKKDIKWASVAKTVIGIGAILIGTLTLFSHSNSSEQETELDESELEKEPNDIEEDYEQLNHSKSEKKEYRGYVPICCRACGGPYPLCRDGCPIFDD